MCRNGERRALPSRCSGKACRAASSRRCRLPLPSRQAEELARDRAGACFRGGCRTSRQYEPSSAPGLDAETLMTLDLDGFAAACGFRSFIGKGRLPHVLR